MKGSIRRLVFVMSLSMLAVVALPLIAVATGNGLSSDLQAPATALENPPMNAPSAGEATPAVEAPAVAPATSCEESLFPAEPMAIIGKLPVCRLIYCDQFDNNYCDYSCTGVECCTARILIPNSFCPGICI